MKKLITENIKILENKFNLSLDDIIEVGATPKKERVFYLLNKLVGNHLEVEPNKILAVGEILASLIYDSEIDTKILSEYIKGNTYDENIVGIEIEKTIPTREKTFIIGLAKSATAIGMATARAIENSYYVSTMRETAIRKEALFEFEESHTLLTTHKCYLEDKKKLVEADRIIIVEDEITSGNTMINLIDKMAKITKAKVFNIVTILNFSNNEFIEKVKTIEEIYGIKVKVNEILKGKLNYEKMNEQTTEFINNNLNCKEDEIKEEEQFYDIDIFEKENLKLENGKNTKMIKKSGYFGISYNEIREIEGKAKKAADAINNKYNKVLVISHGENMYIPSRIAYYISNKAKFKSTTQNKIIPIKKSDYPIKQCSMFEVNDIEYYLYNKDNIEKQYDKVFFIVDSEVNIKLTDNTQIIKI